MGQDVSAQLAELDLDVKDAGIPLDKGKVQVKAVEARNVVKGMFEIGGSDPYLILGLDKQEFKTKVVKSSATPKWNETFTFDVDDDDSVLTCAIFDWDRISKDDLLGAFPIKLSAFADQESHTDWYKMALGAADPKKIAEVKLVIRYTSMERINTVKVTGLSSKTDDVALRDCFPGIKRVLVLQDEGEDGAAIDTQTAFIELASEAEKAKAISKNGKVVDGATIAVVDHARSVREEADAFEEREAAKAEAERIRVAEELARQEEERRRVEEELERIRQAAEEEQEAMKERQAQLEAEQEAFRQEAARKEAAEAEAKAKADELAAKKAAAAEEKKKRDAEKKKKAAAKPSANVLNKAAAQAKKRGNVKKFGIKW